jgi:predicted transcriptional regulator
MVKSSKFELESPDLVSHQEDEQTLAAIDEGLADADTGRTLSVEEVRKRLPKWTTASSTRKER